MREELKTVYRYDAGGRGFKQAAYLLGVVAVLLVFGIVWLKSF